MALWCFAGVNGWADDVSVVLRGAGSTKQRVDEGRGLERGEVVGSLAEPD